MNSVTSAFDKIGFYLLALSVAFAPIPFGSNSDWFAGLLGLLLATALLATIAAPRPNEHGRRLCATALLIAVTVAAWSVIQVVPLDNASWTHPIWKKAEGLTAELRGVIAVSRYQPLYSLGYVLLPIAAFVAGLVYVRDSDRYTAFLHIVLAIACATTVICIAQYLYAPGTLLWADKRHYLGSFTGSFVNPNSAATYFGLVLLMALSAGLRQLERVNVLRLLLVRREVGSGDNQRWAYLLAYFGAAFVVFVALMLTRSRAGILSSMAGAGCLVGAFAYFALRRRMSVLAALGLTAVVLAAAALAWSIYGGQMFQRLELEGAADEQRLCTFKATWRAIEDHFWRGAGLGTFQDVFPHYRMPECGLYGHWNMAHNFYLEGMLSLGVAVFAGCMLAAYAQLLAAFARGMRERRRLRFVPLMCLCALITVSLHSLVDFSLQIPAVAVLACAMLGAGAAISVSRVEGETRRPSPSSLAPKVLQARAGKAS